MNIKRLITIVLIIAPTIVYSQMLSVESLSEMDGDSIAMKMPRYDINDDLCAALFIEGLPIENISFMGNIIGEPSYNNSTYLIYITNKTKRIKLMHEDYLPFNLEFSQYNISIKGGHTYKATLQDYNPQPAIKSYGRGAQYLILKSSKPLTKAIVNGEEWPIIEGKAKKLVPLGKYKYVVESDSLSASGETEVVSTSISHIVSIKLD